MVHGLELVSCVKILGCFRQVLSSKMLSILEAHHPILKHRIYIAGSGCAPVTLFSWVDVYNLKERQQSEGANLLNLDELEVNYAKEIWYHP